MVRKTPSKSRFRKPGKPPRVILGWRDDAPARSIGFNAEDVRPPSGQARFVPVFAEGEGHLLTIAPTGAGKGRSAIIPTLLADEPQRGARGSMIVVDPKGEVCSVTARHRSRLGEVVIVDPYRKATSQPHSLNPFDVVKHTAMGTAEAALLLANLLAPPSYTKDPFWDNRAISLIAGLTAFVLNAEPLEDRHPVRLRTYLSTEDVTDTIVQLMMTKKDSMGRFAYEELGQLLSLSESGTRPSVIGTATQHLTILGDDAVATSLQSTSFDLSKLQRDEPITIYLILPVEKLRSHGRLLRLWISTLLRVIITRSSRPVVPTLFLLDEAAQAGHLDDLVTATTLMRGYGMRIWSFWQDLQQIKRHYPNDWESLITNAQTLQVFGSHWLFTDNLAKLLGVHPSALSLPPGRQLLINADGSRLLARKLDYLEDELFQGRFDPNPLFHRRSERPPDPRAAEPHRRPPAR
jgi:type IV secretion system protein VirD4